MAKVFALIIDKQRDFSLPEGALHVPGAERTLEPMAAYLLGLDPAVYAGAAFTLDTHPAETYAASEEAKQFPPHCLKGSWGWGLAVSPAAVPAAIPVYTLEKGVFDMWEEPGLTVARLDPATGAALWAQDRDGLFRGLRLEGVDTIEVTGDAADYCVRSAIQGALLRGFRVRVRRDLVRGIARQIDEVVAQDFPGRPVEVV